jgi:predicted RNA-binding Zn ribbon-like protein
MDTQTHSLIVAATPSSPSGHGHDVDVDVALDFINTLQLGGEPVDHLVDGSTALAWLVDHGVLHPEAIASRLGRGDSSGAEAVLAKIRRAREALREVVDANAEHRPASARSLAEVNRLLRAREVLVLVPSADGMTLSHRHEGDPIQDALARLAEPIARTISREQRDRLRICANDHCRWVFYDYSRPGRRRWCDMSSCGNRAKAARHRARVHGRQGL